MTGRADLVEELLDRGAQTIIASAVNTNEPRVSITKHTTPLAMACLYARDASVVELLLRRGAQTAAIDENGLTAEELAMHLGQDAVVRAFAASRTGR